MNIAGAAQASGLSTRMIRYYERIALLAPSGRTPAGYRQYGEHDIQILRFIHHARDVGLSLEQVRRLLRLWLDRSCPDEEVQAIARSYLASLNGRLVLLQAMRDTLLDLATQDD
ncbi:HTH-type transcriptional regulator HmrR [compost metagenome]